MTAEPEGLICPRSGRGSLSGQYMMHGAVGSVEMLRTRPPALSAWPEGVSSGYVGACGRAPSTVGDCNCNCDCDCICDGDCGVERAGDGLREPGREYRPAVAVASGGSGGSGRRARSSCGACANRGLTNGCGACAWIMSG